MGHTCPDCGQMCYCGGDWDDIDFGYDAACEHCDELSEFDDNESFYENEETK